MKNRWVLMVLSAQLTTGFARTNAATVDDLSARLRERIEAYHRGATAVTHSLRLVYFHPNDAPPQKGYQERITRIMRDIQDFVRAEMHRNGFGARSIRLETEGDLVKIHTVEGREGTAGYNYDFRYGQKIRRELQTALKGTVDLDRDFVMVFCGLCPRDEQGVYHFRSPYYGWGGSGNRWGLCFAADCELLDTRHFTNQVDGISYTEHLGSFEKSLSQFNQLYIGGIAHELGHGLGLPHNQEKPWEARDRGRAMMGSGNFTYRTELTGGKGSFLTKASALRLATHPMFAGSDRGRFDRTRFMEPELEFDYEPGRRELTVGGRVAGRPEVLAVIAYTDPVGRSNYDAHTWLAEVRDGEFEVTARVHRRGKNELRLQFLHLNGAISTCRLDYTVKDGHPDVDGMKLAWSYSAAERRFMAGDQREAVKLGRENLSRAAQGKFADKLRHLIALAGERPLTSLGEGSADEAWLSAVAWESAEVGWGRPARDQYYSGRGIADGVCVEISGVFHPRALHAHAPARHVFDLGGNWKRFTAVGGLQLGVPDGGSGVFVVKGDGRELFRSLKLGGTASVNVDVDVTGVRQLELLTESGKDGNGGCWTVWGSPRVSR